MLSIGEVAERTGLRPSALRYYEEAGLISPTGRVAGRRHYDPSVLDRLAVIGCAQEAGFSIAELRVLLGGGDASPPRWRALAQRKLHEVDALIERAQGMRRLLEESLRCDRVTLEECATVVRQRPVAGADEADRVTSRIATTPTQTTLASRFAPPGRQMPKPSPPPTSARPSPKIG